MRQGALLRAHVPQDLPSTRAVRVHQECTLTSPRPYKPSRIILTPIKIDNTRTMAVLKTVRHQVRALKMLSQMFRGLLVMCRPVRLGLPPSRPVPAGVWCPVLAPALR